MGGVSASQFSKTVQSLFKFTIANKIGVDVTRVEITSFSRRGYLSISFAVFTGMLTGRNVASLETSLHSFLKDSTTTGFGEKFNDGTGGVTTTGVTVTSEPHAETIRHVSSGTSRAVAVLIAILILLCIVVMIVVMLIGICCVPVFQNDTGSAARDNSANNKEPLDINVTKMMEIPKPVPAEGKHTAVGCLSRE